MKKEKKVVAFDASGDAYIKELIASKKATLITQAAYRKIEREVVLKMEKARVQIAQEEYRSMKIITNMEFFND